jgi:hypothetical protein
MPEQIQITTAGAAVIAFVWLWREPRWAVFAPSRSHLFFSDGAESRTAI